MTPATPRKTAGAVSGVAAYLIWGFIALYFQLLADRGVAAMSLLAHRIIWSLVFCCFLLVLTRRLPEARAVLKNRRLMGLLAISSVLIAINWLAFIYSVQRGLLNQSALGYFMTPLMSVLLGMLVLKERLRPVQWCCLVLAAAGVAVIVHARGQLPWIGLTVATSFGFYGLLRKVAPVGPIVGLTVEAAILAPLGALYILWLLNQPHHASYSVPTYALLILAGAVTAIPLLLFAYSTRQLQLSTIGFLQYLAPTCQLILAIAYRHEAVSHQEIVGYMPIWIALLVFSAEMAMHLRRSRVAVPEIA